MPQCPQCNKPLLELARQCPSCRADLDLLVDYVQGLTTSLSRAEQMTRAGELGKAVWAYLEVLEVDPDNPAARLQVGQVATAVRQFDRTAPGRRKPFGAPEEDERLARRVARWFKRALILLAILTAFGLGFLSGQAVPVDDSTPTETKQEPPRRPSNQLGGIP